MALNAKRLNRLLVVAGFLSLLGLTALLATVPAANTYELSIYAAYPWYFWALACLALFVGNAVVVRCAFDGRDEWRYGFVLVLAVVTLLLLLPYLRGYASLGRADVLTHVGLTRDIMATGRVGDGNVYPNFHLLVLTLSYATGVDPAVTVVSLAGIGSVFSVVALTTLVSSVFGRRRGLLVVPFATVLLTAQSVPYRFSTLLVPFVLYLLVKEQQTRALSVRAALTVSMVSLIIYHPLTTLFVLAIIGLYGVARTLHDRGLFGTAAETPARPVGTVPLAQFVVAVFAVWYLAFDKIVDRFAIVVRNISSVAVSSSPGASYTSTVSQYSPALVDLARIGFVKYGQAAVLLLVGGAYTVWALRTRSSTTALELTFVGAFALFTGLSGLFFAVDLVVGFSRPLLYVKLFGAVLASSLFSHLLNARESRPTARTLLYVTVALLVVTSTLGLYLSPLTVREGQQVTEMELEGSEWFLEERDRWERLSQFGIETARFRDAIYGRETFAEDKVVTYDPVRLPAHFNYSTRETLGASYENDTYIILPRAGRIYYEELYPEYPQFWRFEPSDFRRLSRDGTVSHVYDNGGYDVYHVNGTA